MKRLTIFTLSLVLILQAALPAFVLAADSRDGVYFITAYCACKKCCGSGAKGITAGGTIATEGRTVAADTKILPFGTKIYIEGVGERIVEDTGSAIKGRDIDVFIDSHERALKFTGYGKRKVTVLGNVGKPMGGSNAVHTAWVVSRGGSNPPSSGNTITAKKLTIESSNKSNSITINGTNRSSGNEKFTLNALGSDGKTYNATKSATWTSSNSKIAYVKNGTGEVVSGPNTGTVTITAKFKSLSATAKITVVNSGSVGDSRIYLTPSSISKTSISSKNTEIGQFRVNAVKSLYGTTEDVTSKCTFSVSPSNTTVAWVRDKTGEVISLGSAGTVTITARYVDDTGKILTTTGKVTVSGNGGGSGNNNPTISSIYLSPSSISKTSVSSRNTNIGQFRVYGIKSPYGTTEDITSKCTFSASPSNTTVAWVKDKTGEVISLGSAGTVTITARYVENGKVFTTTGSITVTGTSQQPPSSGSSGQTTLSGIKFVQDNPTVTLKAEHSVMGYVRIQAIYYDSSIGSYRTKDVTNSCTFSAQQYNTAKPAAWVRDRTGEIVSFGNTGTTLITARYVENGKPFTSTTVVTVR